jgi:metabotropic X receptor
VAVQPLARELRGFDEYLEGLRPGAHSAVNPWFNAAWAEAFKCEEPGRAACEAAAAAQQQGLTTRGGYRQQNYLHFVRDAVYAVASALDVLHGNLCKGRPGLCEAMEHLDEQSFLEALRNISFMGKCMNINKNYLFIFVENCEKLTPPFIYYKHIGSVYSTLLPCFYG